MCNSHNTWQIFLFFSFLTLSFLQSSLILGQKGDFGVSYIDEYSAINFPNFKQLWVFTLHYHFVFLMNIEKKSLDISISIKFNKVTINKTALINSPSGPLDFLSMSFDYDYSTYKSWIHSEAEDLKSSKQLLWLSL